MQLKPRNLDYFFFPISLPASQAGIAPPGTPRTRSSEATPGPSGIWGARGSALPEPPLASRNFAQSCANPSPTQPGLPPAGPPRAGIAPSAAPRELHADRKRPLPRAPLTCGARPGPPLAEALPGAGGAVAARGSTCGISQSQRGRAGGRGALWEM